MEEPTLQCTVRGFVIINNVRFAIKTDKQEFPIPLDIDRLDISLEAHLDVKFPEHNDWITSFLKKLQKKEGGAICS